MSARFKACRSSSTPAAWLLLMLPWMLLLTGPAPGEVGGCGADAFLSQPEDFCRDRAAWICRRQQARGEIRDIDACFATIPNTCEGAAWPPSCVPLPTQRVTNACIDALSLVENLDVPPEDLSECNICPEEAP